MGTEGIIRGQSVIPSCAHLAITTTSAFLGLMGLIPGIIYEPSAQVTLLLIYE